MESAAPTGPCRSSSRSSAPITPAVVRIAYGIVRRQPPGRSGRRPGRLHRGRAALPRSRGFGSCPAASWIRVAAVHAGPQRRPREADAGMLEASSSFTPPPGPAGGAGGADDRALLRRRGGSARRSLTVYRVRASTVLLLSPQRPQLRRGLAGRWASGSARSGRCCADQRRRCGRRWNVRHIHEGELRGGFRRRAIRRRRRRRPTTSPNCERCGRRRRAGC